EPNLEGRFITMYSEPDSQGATLDDLGIKPGLINATLSAENEIAPDSRMRSTAFTRFVLSDFGITTYHGWLGEISGRDFPSVQYKLKVYYLSLGKWTFTKEQAEEWEDREGREERNSIRGWWDNLGTFDKIGVAFGLITVFIVLIVIALVYTGVFSTWLSYKSSKSRT
ncbi:unnamed protein product, partial [marine sediment metagenome]